MIELQNITKVFDTRHGPNVVLDDLCTTFPARVNVGILGRNGAGKSTLLSILAGATVPDSGRVVRKGRISFPVGSSGLHGSLTGEENARFVARIYGADEDDVVAFAQEFSEIGNYFAMPVKTYSAGMRGRFGFALSMAIDFDVYLCDEVTSAGDARFRQRYQEAFEQRRSRSSVIMVSHNVGTIRAVCDRAAVLKDGQLLEFDDIEEAAAVYEAC